MQAMSDCIPKQLLFHLLSTECGLTALLVLGSAFVSISSLVGLIKGIPTTHWVVGDAHDSGDIEA